MEKISWYEYDEDEQHVYYNDVYVGKIVRGYSKWETWPCKLMNEDLQIRNFIGLDRQGRGESAGSAGGAGRWLVEAYKMVSALGFI